MQGYLEIWSEQGHRLAPIEDGVITIGRANSSDIRLDDATVSRLHAILERYSNGWSVRDVGSVNGTLVNGEPLVGERRLLSGDEINVGGARLFLRVQEIEALGATSGDEPPPELTRTERRILRALCRPLLDGESFPDPPSVRALAGTFVVSEAAIRQHLLRLYDKFAVPVGDGSRRTRLANEAIRRRAVTVAELRQPLP